MEYELLKNYVQKMYLRGDSYTDIYNYLKSNGADKDQIKKIVLEVEAENKKEIKETPKTPSLFSPTIIIGVAFILISQILYSKGLIVFPISLLGLLGIFLVVKEIINWLVSKYGKNRK